MKATDPFTKMDLKYAEHSFNFAKKCEAVLNEVVRKIEPEFKKLFRVRTGLTPGHFSTTDDCAYSYTRKFRYRAATCVSIYLAPSEGELGFGVSAKVPKKDVERIHRHLDWVEEKGDIYSWHVVGSSTHPTALAKKALADARKLRTALNRVYD